MATAAKPEKRAQGPKETTFTWVGKNKAGKIVRGEQRATAEAVVSATLRRQGILVTKISKQRIKGGGKVTEKDIALFTRQLATMMKSGVPLLQSFEIVGRGHENPAVSKLLLDIKADVETGSSLSQGFRKFPLYFDQLYCNLVAAGEQAGILETLLDRLATYKEKMLAIKSKIKSALFYPVAIIIVAFIITAVIMIFVIPAFKQVFTRLEQTFLHRHCLLWLSRMFLWLTGGPFLDQSAVVFSRFFTCGNARKQCNLRWTGSSFAYRFLAHWLKNPSWRAGPARFQPCLPLAFPWLSHLTLLAEPQAITYTKSQPNKFKAKLAPEQA